MLTTITESASRTRVVHREPLPWRMRQGPREAPAVRFGSCLPADAAAGQTVRVADDDRRALERSSSEVVLDAAVKGARGREEATVLTWRRTVDAALFGRGTASRNGARRREWVA